MFDPNICHHSHEEAETLIPMHVLDASRNDGDIEARYIDIHSADTGVLMLLMDLSVHNIPGQLHLMTGKKKEKGKEVFDF